MSYYITNTTTRARYILLENGYKLNIGPSGTYNATVMVEDKIEDDPTLIALIANGSLLKHSKGEMAEAVSANAAKVVEDRVAEEKALLSEVDTQKNDLISITCTECGKEFFIRESDNVGQTVCDKCAAKSIQAPAEQAVTEVKEEVEEIPVEAETPAVEVEKEVVETPVKKAKKSTKTPKADTEA